MAARRNGMRVQDETVGIVKAPPDVKVPAAPAGFIATNPSDYRGFRPKKAELAVVPDVVLEVTSFRDYETVFGITAPPAAHVMQALDNAGKWSTLLAVSKDWLDYVKSGEGMAWKDTLGLTEKLKAPFKLATAHDPNLLSRLPALARFLGVAKAVAKKANATKKRNARGAAGGGAGGPPVTPPTAPASPTPAPAPAGGGDGTGGHA